MKIIILGAGGIGSVVGALLSRNNYVELIGRKEHVDSINNGGLKIGGCVNEIFNVKAYQKMEILDADDLIILTTKAQDIKEALEPVKHMIRKNNIILALQNGYGNEDLIRSIVDCEVIRGVITTATNFIKPGEVECNYFGDIYIENSKSSQKIKELIDNMPINISIDHNIKERIWMKLIFNCVFNPLTAVLKVKNKEILKLMDIVEKIIDETISVAGKEGIIIDKDDLIKRITDVVNTSGNNTSSMLQDIKKAKKTEIEFLNGKIIDLAKKHGLKVPYNEILYGLVCFLESKNN